MPMRDLSPSAARIPEVVPLNPDLDPLEGNWKKELEHFVAPVSPLFFSIHDPNIREATKAAFWSFGLLVENIQLAYRAGEIYESDVPVGGGSGDPPPWWVLGAMSRLLPSLRARAKQAERALKLDLEAQIFQRWESEWVDELTQTCAEIKAIDPSSLSNPLLSRHLEHIRELTSRAFYIHFQIGIANLIPIYRLVRLCEEWFGWDEHQTMRLMHGCSTGSRVGSEDLDRIADLIRANELATSRFLDSSLTPDDLQLDEPEIAAEISKHLDTFGYRMIQNDPMSPTFAEVPSLTIQLIRDRLSGYELERQRTVEEMRKTAESEADVLLAFRSAAERSEFRHKLERARWAYRLREENVYLTLAHPFALLRFSILEAGRRLAAEGILLDADDVFYGTFEEVRDALKGQETALLAGHARRRRAEALWTLEHPGPDEFGTEAPFPDLRGLPDALREVNEAMLWALKRIRATAPANEDVITGVPASPGHYQGTARVVFSERDFHRVQAGDVLVCPSTSSSWAVLFGSVGALVTDQGGSLSHPAIIAREHGIPAVVATVRATREIRDGQIVSVDGTTGRVEPVEAS
jgi:rifampicin phosphotransferase